MLAITTFKPAIGSRFLTPVRHQPRPIGRHLTGAEGPGGQASLLQYAKRITEAASEGAPVTDCVIAVPAFFGQSQRQAIIDAGSLAGM